MLKKKNYGQAYAPQKKKQSYDRQWWQLHNIVTVSNATELYTYNG